MTMGRRAPGDERRGLCHGGAVGFGRRRRRRAVNDGVAGIALGDVLGQRHHHGPGPARSRDIEGARGGIRDLGRSRRLDHRLGDRAVHPVVVDLLERFEPYVAARHMAYEQHHGRGILRRRVDADRRVGRAGAAGDEGRARRARKLAVRLGGEGRAGLVTAGDEADAVAGLAQRLEHREVALARHLKSGPNVMRQQRGDQGVAAVHGAPPLADFEDGVDLDGDAQRQHRRADREAGVLARVPEHLDHQVRGAVDGPWVGR